MRHPEGDTGQWSVIRTGRQPHKAGAERPGDERRSEKEKDECLRLAGEAMFGLPIDAKRLTVERQRLDEEEIKLRRIIDDADALPAPWRWGSGEGLTIFSGVAVLRLREVVDSKKAIDRLLRASDARKEFADGGCPQRLRLKLPRSRS